MMIREANELALARINAAEPTLVDVVQARDVLPEDDRVIYHAGPPLAWEQMCGPLQGAILGVCVYEAWADDLDEARQLVDSGAIKFRHNHSASIVGPMTGMVSPSMPLIKVENRAFGNVAYSTFNEGIGKVMRFGANDAEVLNRLRWLAEEFGPAVKAAIASAGSIDLRVIIAKAIAMGDELHQRNIAASALFFREIMPHITRTCTDIDVIERISSFLYTNDQFFLNLAMASAKASIDPIKNIEYCTLVSAMSRNGTNFGIKVSALGDQWFEAPVEMPQGLYFPGFTQEDANPDIGDSAIVECVGFGGMSMAAAPAVTQFVGIDGSKAAYDITHKMFTITEGRSQTYTVPTIDFTGIPVGINIVDVVESGTRPYINSGIAHREPGVGQVGAGVVYPPMKCFEQALQAFADKYSKDLGL